MRTRVWGMGRAATTRAKRRSAVAGLLEPEVLGGDEEERLGVVARGGARLAERVPRRLELAGGGQRPGQQPEGSPGREESWRRRRPGSRGPAAASPICSSSVASDRAPPGSPRGRARRRQAPARAASDAGPPARRASPAAPSPRKRLAVAASAAGKSPCLQALSAAAIVARARPPGPTPARGDATTRGRSRAGGRRGHRSHASPRANVGPALDTRRAVAHSVQSECRVALLALVLARCRGLRAAAPRPSIPWSSTRRRRRAACASSRTRAGPRAGTSRRPWSRVSPCSTTTATAGSTSTR